MEVRESGCLPEIFADSYLTFQNTTVLSLGEGLGFRLHPILTASAAFSRVFFFSGCYFSTLHFRKKITVFPLGVLGLDLISKK